MNLTTRFPTEADQRTICAWRYDGDCAIYDLPPYEEMKRRETGFFRAGSGMVKARSRPFLSGYENPAHFRAGDFVRG